MRQSHIVTGWDFEIHLRDGDIEDVDSFLDELQGRANPFWVPGPLWAYKITAGVSTTRFKVSTQGAEKAWALSPGTYLHFKKPDNDSQTGRISSIADNGDGTETITLVSALPVAADSTWSVVPLYLVRLAADEEEVQIIAERYQRRVFRVVELPNDYARATAGTLIAPDEPVYLYKFTAELDTGTMAWYYTSHPSDVSVSGSTWISAPINHGSLTRSVKLGGTTGIQGDYDTIEPLRLSVPLRVYSPLLLEILKTTTALGAPVSQMFGWVTRPELSGKWVKATIAEWGDVLTQRFPSMHIDRECNYEVYEANTCKASAASKTYSVTISSISSRTVVITGAGLAGMAANWLALGRLTVGTGLSRRIVAILSSTAASGTSVTLTVSDVLDAEAPIGATAVAGCDRLRTTCDTKFGNLVNWGGHAPPRSNLTLNAIQAEAAGADKK